ncbi:DUF2846 domain-containing protein [Larkinella sp. GY13]|uniref:DUF2846 domain-containing protein n=1 Tax=Larkinella sp. GY13 TaxID=3453720 RepID=UPI003EEE5247
MKLAPLFLLARLLLAISNNDLASQASHARLIIYRQREFAGNAFEVKVNEKNQGFLPTNRYLELTLDAGRVKIETGRDYFSDPQTLWLTLQADRTYYVKAVEEVDFLSRTLLLAPIKETQALEELRTVKPLTPQRAGAIKDRP